jgi:hypothetical protein
MESFSSENRTIYTDVTINTKIFVPTKREEANPPKEPSRFMKNPYKDMK